MSAARCAAECARRVGAARALPALIAAALLAGCAAGGAGRASRAPRVAVIAPVADSLTLGLWRFDETGGARAGDSGPYRLHGSYGLETRTDFGRFRNARTFARAAESFVLVPFDPEMESPPGFTIEAWIRPTAYGQYELTPIASRWTEVANEKSWLFAIVGRKVEPPFATLPSPGWFSPWVRTIPTGRLVLLLQPDQASAPQSFGGALTIPLETWTHVAASWDGEIVRLWVDGRLDAQYALRGTVRRTNAPLQVGNAIDSRRLTEFSGQLRLDATADANPYYAYEGAIDELRLSAGARESFESVTGR